LDDAGVDLIQAFSARLNQILASGNPLEAVAPVIARLGNLADGIVAAVEADRGGGDRCAGWVENPA